MSDYIIKTEYDAVVVGAGHAGVESALALSRLGNKTALVTLNLDSISFMACNPSIGGTAKGHLVREIDALGGEMGINTDKTLMQIKMLNRGKGAAVQSLRAQADKNYYHRNMKWVLENTPNLDIVQSETISVEQENGCVTGVTTAIGAFLQAKAVVLATGVYLNSRVIAGEWEKAIGPNGFEPSNRLTKSLIELGFNVRRFKTGTPARIDRRSIDFSKCEIQNGETNVYPFSFLSEGVPQKQTPCYLTYTNAKTHEIIRQNLHRSPLYNGSISGTGPRYCPSIETKVDRFPDKERHQIFLEPEGENNNEIYVQGMSSSLPHDVQEKMYRTISGLENCKFMRYAYAIEYDCIDSLDLTSALEFKKVKGLFCAGQINGTSGYEEAAAQGLIAGINAANYICGKPPLVLSRDSSYIGVLVDDLVTKGTVEPYRMMTSRAEYRIFLRQDNADLRLTEIGRKVGLVSDYRYEVFTKKKALLERYRAEMEVIHSPLKVADFVLNYGGKVNGGLSFKDMIKRGIPIADIKAQFGAFEGVPYDVLETLETDAKYEGYLKKGLEQIEKAKRLEDKIIPDGIDYSKIEGLRIEAREQLGKVRPRSLGQAERIYGVNPADIAVLMVYLNK